MKIIRTERDVTSLCGFRAVLEYEYTAHESTYFVKDCIHTEDKTQKMLDIMDKRAAIMFKKRHPGVEIEIMAA